MSFSELKGKRLLVLGAAGGTDYISKFKRENDVVIVTTADCQHQDNPLFRIADEKYSVSPLDKEGLTELCRNQHIDGIFAGGNEEIIDAVIDVTGELNLPQFVNKAQFKLNHDKAYFHEVMKKYGLKCPEEYQVDETFSDPCLNDIQYPVITKPVDLCGGKGVCPCRNKEELKKNYIKAQEMSISHRAIVERFIPGEEFTAVYTLKDGDISLSAMKDKYMSEEHELTTSQFDICLAPSKRLSKYCNGPDKKIRELISDLGFHDGTIFFQGFFYDNDFIFHEAGCRMTGAEDFRMIDEVNGINFYEMMLHYSLSGKMEGYSLDSDNPSFKSPMGKFSIYARGGIIGEQIGFDKIRMFPNVIKAELLKKEGEKIEEDSALKQRVLNAYIKGKDLDDLSETISEIQNSFDVKDTNGRSMLFKKFNVERLNQK